MSSVNAANTETILLADSSTLPQQPSSSPPASPTTTPSDPAASGNTGENNAEKPNLTINTEPSTDGRSSDAEKMLDSAMDGPLGPDGGDPGSEPMVLINTGEGSENLPTDDGQQWMDEDSHDLKRVKVYELIGARWVDQGTAFCFGDFHENEALLIARAEADYQHVILSTTIRASDVYQRQQDTLIVWTEPDGVDYALSFQDPEGCAEVWNFIQEVQRHMNATESGLSSSPLLGEGSATTANIIRTGHLPQPTLGIIGEIEKAIKALTRTSTLKERVCEYIQSEDYIKGLIEVLTLAEDLESIENLHALCTCMQTILALNDHSMYEHILDDDIFFGVVGMLEYDPEFPTHKANYREFLRTSAQYHQPIPIRDETIQKKVHHTYRLQFLKDVVLARSIDDSAFNVLNSCIIFNQIDIITHVQTDPQLLREVVGMFMDEDLVASLGLSNPAKEKEKQVKTEPDESPKPNGLHLVTSAPKEEDVVRKREVVYLIQQLSAMAKNVQIGARTALLRTLVDRGILFLVQWAFAQPESDPEGKAMIAAAGDIFTPLLEFDLIGVRGHVVKQLGLIERDKEAAKKGEKGRERETLLMLLCRVLVRSKDLAIQSQLGEHIRLILEVPSSETEPHPVLGAKMYQRAKDDPAMEKFLDYFYKQCAEILFKPFFDLPEFKTMTETSLPLSRERTNLLLHLCELLSSFALQHSFRSHFYMLSSNVAVRVASLLRAKDKHLRLAALRFFRVLLRLNNRNLFNHLIKHDILKPLLELTLQESRRDNLLSSSCQELFDFIRRENLKELINHCMTKHEDLVKALAATQLGSARFKGFIRRWEINIEPPPKEEEKVELVRPNGIGIRKWGQGRLMEAEEEDYFNTDDDEDEILPVLSTSVFPKAAPNTLKRKRPRGSSLPLPQRPPPFARTPPLRSLVDYDDADEPTRAEADKAAGGVQGQLPTSPSSPSQARMSSPRISQQASKPISISLTPGEDQEDFLLESLVAKGGPPLPDAIKPPEVNLSSKRHREDDDDELLERLASKAKRLSTGPGQDKPEVSGKATGLGKPAEEGPKKIKLKLSSPTIANPFPSSTGAKDGDTDFSDAHIHSFGSYYVIHTYIPSLPFRCSY
ncbi:unnamed protein product [Somion occarium]|uniref:Serine/threonine-protein phosphatase 4 regulatory subunit 3-like central domain-containing protein n=1 Tax=Somion occarium TaxID=3059160 RepID=A0ABP1D104_9APHY